MKTKYICDIMLTFFVGLFCTGLPIWAYFLAQMNSEKHVKCDTTSCSVNVVDTVCFAKVDYYPNPYYFAVKCDKDRRGYYNTTLPCDYDKKTMKPILYCVEKTTRIDHIVGFIITGFVLILIIMCLGFMRFTAEIFEGFRLPL